MVALLGDFARFRRTRMRSAMRTVENRCEIRSDILPCVSSAKRLEHFVFGTRVERRRRLVQNQQLRIAQIGARQRDLLPFAARQVDSAFEPAAQQLIVALGQLADHLLGEGSSSAAARMRNGLLRLFDAADADIFRCGHLVAHEILEDDADFLPQVVEVVFAQIDAVEQDLALRSDRTGA